VAVFIYSDGICYAEPSYIKQSAPSII